VLVSLEYPVSDDLWATEPATAPPQIPPTPAPVAAAPAVPSAIMRLTLKEDGVPWLTIESDSAADLNAIMDDKTAIGGVLKRASAISAYWRNLGAQNAHQATATALPAAPQAAPQVQASYGVPGPQTAPGGERRFCPHGEMPFKAGVSRKTGKPYAMWVCSHPNQAQQCRPQNPGDPVQQAAPAAYDAPPF